MKLKLPLTIQVKIVKVGNSLHMTIPKTIIRALNWEVEDTVEIGAEEDTMIVKKGAHAY
jgi:antitoxin component of MazEF toxin-antitoxin module